MWRRGVCAEEQTGDQTRAPRSSIVTREVPAAVIKSAKRDKIPVGRNVAVAAEHAAGPLEEIGYDNNICLVISGTGLDPCLPLAHIIGCAKIGVAVSAPDL